MNWDVMWCRVIGLYSNSNNPLDESTSAAVACYTLPSSPFTFYIIDIEKF
jgi:hypothetical protein